MSRDTIILPDGTETGLGCLLPASFPTNSPKFSDTFAAEMMTIDQIRATLVSRNGASMWGRRERFAGAKYIRDQKSTSACNGWSTSGALSRIRELRGEPYVCLSGADAYSQMNGNRDEGSTLADGMKIVEQNGIAPEDMVPWNMIYSSQIPSSAKQARTRFKGFTTYAIDSEEEIGTAIVLGRIVVVAVHATNAYMKEDSEGVCMGGNGVGNHSTGCQDIRMQSDGTLNFDEFGSWNVTNHTGGYTWLAWNKQLRQTVTFHRFWAIVSSTDDTGDSSTPPPVGG